MIKAYKILQKKVEETIQNYIKKTFKADIDEKDNFLARMHMVGQMSKYIKAIGQSLT